MAASQHDVRGGAAAREQWSASRHRWNDAVNTSVHRTWPSLQHHIAIARGRGTGSAPRQQRRRRGRRSTCSETVEDASSSSPDVRLQSKFRAQKYIITRHHVVSSCAIITWFSSLGWSALTHLRERHSCLRQLRNQFVVITHNFRISCKTCLTHIHESLTWPDHRTRGNQKGRTLEVSQACGWEKPETQNQL